MSWGDIVLHAAHTAQRSIAAAATTTTKDPCGCDDDDDDDAASIFLPWPALGNILGWLEYYNYKRNRPQRCQSNVLPRCPAPPCCPAACSLLPRVLPLTTLPTSTTEAAAHPPSPLAVVVVAAGNVAGAVAREGACPKGDGDVD